jgi:fructooligosaccharide transport system substrate-binding protein
MKSKTLLVMFVITALIVLAACTPAVTPTATSAPETTEAATEPAATEVEAGPKEEVVLHFLKYANDQESKAMAEIVDAFHKSEDGKWAHVQIEFDAKPFAELFPSIERAVATGSDVDIVQADGPDVKHFAYNGVLKDLTEYFTEEEMAQWAPQSIQEGSMNGHFYAPPMVQSCQLMWFNKDMVEAAGIDVSKPESWTYGEDGTALANWQKLTIDKNGDGTPEVFGLETAFTNSYWVMGPVRSNGAAGSPTYKGVGDDGMSFVGYFDTEEAVEAFTFLQDLAFKYKIMSSERVNDMMLTGIAATTVYTDTIVGNQKMNFPDFKMGAIEPPYFVTPVCQTGSWHYGITSNTEHLEEALAFVKFVSSDEGASYIWKYKNQLPANVNLYNSIEEFKDPSNPRSVMANFFQKYGIPRIETPAYTEYNALFGEFWKTLMAGETDIQGLATEYAELMEEAAAKYDGWQNK